MFKLFILFLFIIFPFFVFSQKNDEKTINSWLKENNYLENPDYLYFTTLSKSTRGDVEVEALIKIEKELAKIGVKNMISDNLKDLNFIDFSNLEKYFIESDRKYISVVCVINKREVSDYWTRDIVRKLENLKLSLSESQISVNMTSAQIEEMLSNTRITRKEIDRYEQIAFRLNPKIDMSEINLFKTDIDGKINNLNSRKGETILTEKLKNAQRKRNNQDYMGALTAFKDLKLEYPNNNEVLTGIEESFGTLIKVYDLRIAQFEINENYASALKTVDSLINLDIDLFKKYSSKLEDLRKKNFYLTCDKTEKLLRYKTVSSEQLKNYLVQLKELKDIEPSKYYKLKSNTDRRLLDYDLRITRSEVYNKRYENALSQIPIIKSNYDLSRRIEWFEREIDRKIYRSLKKDFLISRPRLYNIEPSVFLMSPANVISKNINNFNNLNFNYSLGVYRRLGIKPKNKTGNFKYTLLGLKFDYLDSKQTINVNSTYARNNSFFNPQLSLGVRKFIYIDLGYLFFNNNSNPSLFSSSISLYLPLGYFSVGLETKYLTDFKQTRLLMSGVGIKFNFGFKKKYNADDKNEIQTSILKLKQ